VVLDFNVGRDPYQRLIIDPKKHTVRASPALRFSAVDLRAMESTPGDLLATLSRDNRKQPITEAIPILVRHGGQRWSGDGQSSTSGTSVVFQGRRHSLNEDWRLLVFKDVPRCSERGGSK
jgi:hypothetical protein